MYLTSLDTMHSDVGIREVYNSLLYLTSFNVMHADVKEVYNFLNIFNFSRHYAYLRRKFSFKPHFLDLKGSRKTRERERFQTSKRGRRFLFPSTVRSSSLNSVVRSSHSPAFPRWWLANLFLFFLYFGLGIRNIIKFVIVLWICINNV